MTQKDASTIKARKTNTESASNPQTMKIATSKEKIASILQYISGLIKEDII